MEKIGSCRKKENFVKTILLISMQENKFLKFLGFMWNPLSWVMEAAAVMAIVLANGGVSNFHFRYHINPLPKTNSK